MSAWLSRVSQHCSVGFWFGGVARGDTAMVRHCATGLRASGALHSSTAFCQRLDLHSLLLPLLILLKQENQWPPSAKCLSSSPLAAPS